MLNVSRTFDKLFNRPTRGVSVFELGAVVVSVSLIAIGTVWATSGRDDRDRTEEAFRVAQRIRGAAESWRRENANGCPTLSVLKHEAYLDADARTDDPWGQRYRLRCGGDQVIVSSPGRDGKPNTSDDVRVPHVSG